MNSTLSKSLNPIAWLRQNLFNTWYNSILTLVCLVGIGWGLIAMFQWLITVADWRVVEANLGLFFAGRYPQTLYWRLWTIVEATALLGGITWGVNNRIGLRFRRPFLIALGAATIAIILLPLGLVPRLWLVGVLLLIVGGGTLGYQFADFVKGWLYFLWLLLFPVALWLVAGGLGILEGVPNSLWTGLLLTLLTAMTSIVLCFPVGVLLALGRQSQLPVVKYGCIGYIEIVRGLPLIGVLFLSQNLLPFFLPVGVTIDEIIRAIAGLTLFSAAYLAENVRGGLQAVPTGQAEAAKALGLNSVLVTVLIVLPQALKAVIPALVGQFIGLFKDTSLLSLVGLIELTGIARSILANPKFLGQYAEVYLFIGIIYFLFCYSMAAASRRIENRLGIAEGIES
jgi:general L-amino acid transport system permease protein